MTESAMTYIRPSRPVRLFSALVAVVGLSLGLSGLAAGSDVGGGVVVGLAGLVGVVSGAATWRARVWVAGGIAYSRYVRTRAIPAAEIRALSIHFHGSGANLYVRVDRVHGRPVWLPATGRSDTKRNRQRLDGYLADLRQALSLT